MKLSTERKILKFIQEYHDQHHWAPSVREIAEAVEIASPSTIQRHLEVLAARGKVEYKGVRQVRVIK